MSHIATVGRHHSRASAQARQQQHQQEEQQQQSHSHNINATINNNDSDPQATARSSQCTSRERRLSDAGRENSSSLDRSYGGLSQISVITITSGDDDDDDDLSEEMNIRRTRKSTRNQTKAARGRRTMSTGSFMWSSNPLGHIKTISDIEAHIDSDLEQANAISRLEERWQALTKNFETVLSHLQECSNEVTNASKNFLQTMFDSVDTTCDRVDDALKAQHQLMTMCENLATKLSIVGTFRDEIRTLRKSVDTLEQLYKNRPPSLRAGAN